LMATAVGEELVKEEGRLLCTCGAAHPVRLVRARPGWHTRGQRAVYRWCTLRFGPQGWRSQCLCGRRALAVGRHRARPTCLGHAAGRRRLQRCCCCSPGQTAEPRRCRGRPRPRSSSRPQGSCLPERAGAAGGPARPSAPRPGLVWPTPCRPSGRRRGKVSGWPSECRVSSHRSGQACRREAT
jgi:hypothetical protein